MTTLLVALGGGVGAVLRFGLDSALRGRFGMWVTTLINATGSLALGLLAGFAVSGYLGGTVLAVLATGVCGGYTTFSTATVETLHLVRSKQYRAAVEYSMATLGISVGAVWLGVEVAYWLAAL